MEAELVGGGAPLEGGRQRLVHKVKVLDRVADVDVEQLVLRVQGVAGTCKIGDVMIKIISRRVEPKKSQFKSSQNQMDISGWRREFINTKISTYGRDANAR